MSTVWQCLQVLGLPAGASHEQIKQAYHDLVKVWHPDRFAHDPRLQKQAEEKLKTINEAYDLLMGSRAETVRQGPARPTAQPTAKDKNWMMPIVSFITLLIAIAVISMVFSIYGRDSDPVHPQKSAQGVM